MMDAQLVSTLDMAKSDTFISKMTIAQLEDWVSTQHRKMSGSFEFQQLGTIKQNLLMLSSIRTELDAITRKVNIAYLEIQAKTNSRIKMFKRQLQTMSDMTLTDEKVDSIPRLTYSESPTTIEFAPGVPASCVTIVEKLEDIPDTSLYWVSSIQQFAHKICGQIIRGNIGTIYPAVHSSSKQVTKVSLCRYGRLCRNIGTISGCNYYHDPLFLDRPQPEKAREIRNYTNGSWIYTPDTPRESNKMMRHIGDRSTIFSDVANVSTAEAVGWVDQSMHTLLVTLVLSMYGKIPHKPPDDIMSVEAEQEIRSIDNSPTSRKQKQVKNRVSTSNLSSPVMTGILETSLGDLDSI